MSSYGAANGRPIDALLANAGRGLGKAFLDQECDDDPPCHRHQRHRNRVSRCTRWATRCAARKQGRILFTGSIAGFMPGTFQAVYNGTKAFIDSFSFALRAELKD